MLVPVVGMATAWWLLDEVPTAVELVGGAVLLAGVAAAALLARRRPPRAWTRPAPSDVSEVTATLAATGALPRTSA